LSGTPDWDTKGNLAEEEKRKGTAHNPLASQQIRLEGEKIRRAGRKAIGVLTHTYAREKKKIRLHGADRRGA